MRKIIKDNVALGGVDERQLEESHTFPRGVITEIQRMADEGIYAIRGFGAKRQLPTLDDLLFFGASASRYPRYPRFALSALRAIRLKATVSAARPVSRLVRATLKSRSS